MDNDYLLQQKIELLFDLGFKKIINEIKTVKDDVSSLRSDLAKLHHEMNANANSQQQMRSAPQMQQMQRAAPSMQAMPQQRVAPQQSQMQQPQMQQSQMQQQPQQRLAPVSAASQRQQQVSEAGFNMNAPIDRNNVSPATVSIEKIFYAGGRK